MVAEAVGMNLSWAIFDLVILAVWGGPLSRWILQRKFFLIPSWFETDSFKDSRIVWHIVVLLKDVFGGIALTSTMPAVENAVKTMIFISLINRFGFVNFLPTSTQVESS